MKEENEYLFGEEETLDIVQKYEDMLKRNRSIFFDVVEFENIIDYYLNNENAQRASQAVDIATSMHPYSSEIQIKKAELLIIDKKYAEALSILKFLVKIEPDNGEVFFLKGQAHLEQGEAKLAHEAFWHSTQCFTEDKVDLLYRIGSLYLEVDYFIYALRYFLYALGIYPESLNVLFELGYCYERLGELEKSDKYYNKYLDINPFSSSVWYNLGIVHTRNGDFAKALDAYDFALAVEPTNSSAIHNKANTLATIEKYKEAAECFAELLEFEPENPRIYASIGECYEKLGSYEVAIEYYNRSLQILPTLSEAHFGIGVVNLKTQRYNLALESIRKAIALEPENYDYWLGLAKVLFEMGNEEEAINAYREATTLNPDEPDAYIGLSEIMLFRESFSDVEEIFHEVGEKFSDIPALKVIYAAALYLQDKPKIALNLIKQAKALTPFAVEDFLSVVSVVDDQNFLDKLKMI